MQGSLIASEVAKVNRIGTRAYYRFDELIGATKRLAGKRMPKYVARAVREARKSQSELALWGMHP